MADGDALDMLVTDHRVILQSLDRFDDASSGSERGALALEICQRLNSHMSCEEEFLYPAASKVLPDHRIVRTAELDHAALKVMMRRIEILAPEDPQFGPALALLEEHVRHHLDEEERELFPPLRRVRLDLARLGCAIATRQRGITRLMGLPVGDQGGPLHRGPQPPSGMVTPRHGTEATSRSIQR